MHNSNKEKMTEEKEESWTEYMKRNQLVTKSLPLILLSTTPVRKRNLQHVTESDLLIYETKLALVSDVMSVPILASRHASEGLFHNEVIDLAKSGDNRFQIPATSAFWDSPVSAEEQRLFVKSHMTATATADAEELHLQFGDIENLDFWLSVVVDLDKMCVLKLQGRHQSGWTIVFSPFVQMSSFHLSGSKFDGCVSVAQMSPFHFSRPKFYGYISGNLLHVYDSSIGAEAFKVVCDLTKFVEWYRKCKKQRTKDSEINL